MVLFCIMVLFYVCGTFLYFSTYFIFKAPFCIFFLIFGTFSKFLYLKSLFAFLLFTYFVTFFCILVPFYVLVLFYIYGNFFIYFLYILLNFCPFLYLLSLSASLISIFFNFGTLLFLVHLSYFGTS